MTRLCSPLWVLVWGSLAALSSHAAQLQGDGNDARALGWVYLYQGSDGLAKSAMSFWSHGEQVGAGLLSAGPPYLQPSPPQFPVQPMQPMQPMQTMLPMQSMQPMQEMQAMQPVQPTRPMQPLPPLPPQPPLDFVPPSLLQQVPGAWPSAMVRPGGLLEQAPAESTALLQQPLPPLQPQPPSVGLQSYGAVSDQEAKACALSCVIGQGLCQGGVCLCTTPFTGEHCDKVSSGGTVRFSYPMAVAIVVLAIVFGIGLGTALTRAVMAAKNMKEMSAMEEVDAPQPQVWRAKV